MKWLAYYRLLRFDKPTGILLLWYPTAWALWAANRGTATMRTLFLFSIGTVLMRTAGCVINDMADRHIDPHVERTKLRPIASGSVSLLEAFFLLLFLLIGALIIVMQLPISCFLLAMIALLITLIYPFCKRRFQAPQIVLGLAFSMGMPMAYLACRVPFDSGLILLWVINFLWIIAYDTMYAMTDKRDDLKIGVQSTAIYFGDYDLVIISALLLVLQSLWLCWAIMNTVYFGFYALWVLAIVIMLHQRKLIHARIPQDCFKAFRVSIYYGLVMWIAVVLAFFKT